jgi:hypothetical protein
VIVSRRLPLGQAPDAFGKFDRREEAYVKVILDSAASLLISAEHAFHEGTLLVPGLFWCCSAASPDARRHST